MQNPSFLPPRHPNPSRLGEMLRYLIPALIVVNLLLFGRLLGWLPGFFGDSPDPGRIARQVNPEQIRILPLQESGNR
jgi:hypothetical protein